MAKRTTKTMTVKIKMVIKGDNTHRDMNWWMNRFRTGVKGDSCTVDEISSTVQCETIGVVKDTKYFLLRNMEMHKKLMKEIISDLPWKTTVVGRIIKPRHDNINTHFPQIETTFNLPDNTTKTTYVLLDIQANQYTVVGPHSKKMTFQHTDPDVLDHIKEYCRKAILDHVQWNRTWGGSIPLTGASTHLEEAIRQGWRRKIPEKGVK